MLSLFKAFLFRLVRDLTFRITLIIGVGLALLMTAIYFILGQVTDNSLGMLTGENMLVQSLSPAQNFGIAIPVNLISFTVIEFSHGTIRNKIIAGNSKGKIYASLFLSGLVFSVLLIVSYALLCFVLGTIFGGFHPNNGQGGTLGLAAFDSHYLVRMLITGLISYVSITSFAVFFATLFRQIGGTIPVVIIGIIGCYFVAMLPSLINSLSNNEGLNTFLNVVRIVDPLYAISAQEMIVDTDTGVSYLVMSDQTFIAAIINNLVYATIFFLGGFFIFRKRDVK